MDNALFYLINRDLQNRLFDFLMPLLSAESHFRLPLLIAWICLLVWGGRKGRVIAVLVLLLLLFSDQVSYLLKLLVRRPRPCRVLPEVHLLAGCSRSYSFPSNHAANVFSIGMYLSYFYRWLLVPALIVCLGVGLSRIYVGVHYPSDVAGGALLGLLCATLWILLHRAILAVGDRRRTMGSCHHG
ncbi:MAG: phosphatase PAP2 family protein [candidate division NC10 bacterium]|nr:phosphatase PAP2 family protein [candidate division NC10 bacterium]